jgi:hypothetical protein
MKTPRQRPHSVNRIVSFAPHSKRAVLDWLMVNFMDDCSLTSSNVSAVDRDGYWRWRLSLNESDKRVLLEREEDLAIFTITWCDT